MEIELSDEIRASLEKKAAANGMSVSRYANLLMQEQLQDDSTSAVRRAAVIDAWIEHMKSSSSVSGRNGREWREFIHEGHAD
jgi:hypothetical protein